MSPVRTRTSRTLLAVVMLCCAAVLATACGGSGSDESGDGGGGAGDAGSGEAVAAADGEAFPVAIEHKYGSTTVEARPERVVTLGLSDQDPLLALGITPVGVTEWFGEQPHAVWPWATDALGDATPEVVSTAAATDFESIAAQRPDLILAVYSGLTQEDYEKLSQIAPTVAQPGEYVDYGVPWQEQTEIVGRAVGESERAEELVAEVEAKVAQARADHPEFEGATGLVASPYNASKVALFGPQDVRGRMLTELGFELPPEVAELAGDQFNADIGPERIDLLDVDALVMLLEDVEENMPMLEEQTLFTNLDVYRDGRAVYLGTYDPLGGATSFVTVLSIPFLLDGLVPLLAAAVDGDPATTA